MILTFSKIYEENSVIFPLLVHFSFFFLLSFLFSNFPKKKKNQKKIIIIKFSIILFIIPKIIKTKETRIRIFDF